jgi:hypothetical protein
MIAQNRSSHPSRANSAVQGIYNDFLGSHERLATNYPDLELQQPLETFGVQTHSNSIAPLPPCLASYINLSARSSIASSESNGARKVTTPKLKPAYRPARPRQERLQHRVELFHDDPSGVLVSFRQQDCEFIATYTRHTIGCTQTGAVVYQGLQECLKKSAVITVWLAAGT